MKNLTIFLSSPNETGITMKFVVKFLGRNILNSKKKLINFVYLYKKNIKPCYDCGFCTKYNLSCSIKSDDMYEIYNFLETSEILIFASPIYNFGFPAPLKLLLDRCQIYYHNKYRKKIFASNRKAILLITGGSSNGIGIDIMEHQIHVICSLLGIKFLSFICILGTDKIIKF
ncbi:MAG: flavodoxin family protein [Candidatus Improbicoccus devescovinae]|nr:MAG: flavodoxin family protein [Candidatus Improbicoccus devescovinae]